VEEDKLEYEEDNEIIAATSKKTFTKNSAAYNDRRSMSMLSPHEQDHYNKMTFGDAEVRRALGNNQEPAEETKFYAY
jgi:hypothetical protein